MSNLIKYGKQNQLNNCNQILYLKAEKVAKILIDVLCE